MEAKTYRPWQTALALFALALALAVTIRFHRDLVNAPFPLDSHEPAQAILAQGVAQGVDFTAMGNLPRYSEVYGPLYPALAGALCAHGWACDVRGQRALVALLLGMVLVVLALLSRRLGVPWLETACVVSWAYELLLINVTPIARPDALGLLLWISGLAVPFLLDYSLASLGAATVLFTLAAATKLYFLCGPGFLALALLARRPRALPYFVALQALLVGLAAAWLSQHRPFLFYGSILAQSIGGLTFSYAYMFWQIRQVCLLHSPGLLLLAYAALLGLFSRERRQAGWEWALYGGLGLGLFVAILGGSLGARLTYLIQLAVVPFLPYGVAASLRVFGRNFLLLGILVVSVVWAMGQTVHAGFEPAGRCRQDWDAANARVAASRRPFVEGSLDMALQDRPELIHETGMSRDLYQASLSPRWQTSRYALSADIAKQWQAWYRQGMERMLDPGTDLVVLSSYSPYYLPDALAKAGLRKQASIFLQFPQTAYPKRNLGVVFDVFSRPPGPR